MGTAWKVIPCLPVYKCWSGVQQRSCACVMSWAGALITALCCLVLYALSVKALCDTALGVKLT